MKNMVSIALIVAITFCLGLSGMSHPLQKPAQTVVTTKSANWQVTVVRAAKYTKARISPYAPNQYLEPPVGKEDCYNLALELSFVYLGPPGDISAPAVLAINEKGEKFHAMGNISMSSSDVDALSWLVTLARPEPDKQTLKGGEKFGDKSPITFYIGDIPLSSTEIKIGFADVAPVPVKLSQLK